MLSKKVGKEGMYTKQEKLAHEVYESILESRMKLWEEEGDLSAQALEIRKRNLWEDCCQAIQQTASYGLAISRIQKMLSSRYGKEFSLIAQEIQPGTVTDQELTTLVIKLQNMFTKNTDEGAVKAVLMPYIERNEAHRLARLQAAREHTATIRAQRQAAEQAAAAALQEAAAAKEKVAQLLEQLAKLGAQPNPALETGAPQIGEQKGITRQFDMEKDADEQKRIKDNKRPAPSDQDNDNDQDKHKKMGLGDKG